MGECLISRRGGEVYKLPTLNASYPKDVTAMASANGTASFSISISEHGKPEAYSYQWYVNGQAVSGAVTSNYTIDLKTAGTKTVYCVVTNKAGSTTSRLATITIQDPIPADYICGCDHNLVKEDDYNWRLECLTSGTLIMPNDMAVDIFLLGGGGAGGYNAAAGGGGGYTQTYRNIPLSGGTEYTIIVGAGGIADSGAGGTSWFGDYYANGGKGGENGNGGAGGSGGAAGGGWWGWTHGGSNGSNGQSGGGNVATGTGKGGAGQITTTRAFAESSGALYAGGGGGGQSESCSGTGGAGGGGSGNGGNGSTNMGGGGGGGGSWEKGGNGGSGIVIIRNAR